MIKSIGFAFSFLLVVAWDYPCSGQELAAKLTFDRSNVKTDTDKGKKEFYFYISGASSKVISDDLKLLLDSSEKIMDYTLEMETALRYRGYILAKMELGPIEMVGMMMSSGVSHVELDGRTIPIKELRKQIRQRQAKTLAE